MRIARVETRRCAGGEGSLWDPIEQALYFIDYSGQKVHRYDPAVGTTRSWDESCIAIPASVKHVVRTYDPQPHQWHS